MGSSYGGAEVAWPKPVVFTIRQGPNFLWHMLAVSRIGYDSEYADRFSETVSPGAVNTLRQCDSRLRFGNGNSGSLTGLFTSLPSWLRLETRADFVRYFEIVDRCFQEGSFGFLTTEYPAADWADPFFRHLPGSRFPQDPEDEASLRELRAAYLDSFDAYASLVWPEARTAMVARTEELTAWYGARDYVSAWEKELTLVFAAPRFEFTLCYSNANGPDYNSLGYSSNLIYYGKPLAATWQFVSHEIGAHLMNELQSKARDEGALRPDCLYRAYESLVMFYNSRLLAPDKLEYDLPPSFYHRRLLALYSDLCREDLTSPILLRRGAEFLAAHEEDVPHAGSNAA